TATHITFQGHDVLAAARPSRPSSSTKRSIAAPRGARPAAWTGRGASAIEVTGERQQRQHARALDRRGELLLVHRARAGHAARHDLAAVGHEAAEALFVLVIDERHLLEAQLAVLLLETLAFAFFRHVDTAPVLRLDPRKPRAARHEPHRAP